VRNQPTEQLPYSEQLRYWDDLWVKLHKGRGGMLYTTGEPRSIYQLEQRCYFEDLWNLLGPRAAKARYLELGAGRGTTAMYLSSRGCDVTMVDLSESGFKLAKANFARQGLKEPSFVVADATNTGLAAESWDSVYSIGLLEHFDDPVPILSESLRLLRPGGLLFHVIVPSMPSSHSLLSQLIFNPFGALLGASKQALQVSLGRRQISLTTDAGDVLRTDYSRQQYLDWMNSLPARDVTCLPYNAFHRIYASAKLESRITMRLYRWHHTLKKALRMYPLLKTFSWMARCYLLISTKDQR